MAEALLRRQVAERGIDLGVSSAGTTADGYPASEPAVRVMHDLGLDISGHRSRVISPELVGDADLIIAMAREHVREVVVLDPPTFARTFTLKELVRRGNELGARTGAEPLASWLGRLQSGRTPSMHLGSSATDDIADPMGQRMAVYERTADEISELTEALCDLLWADLGALDPTRSGADR